MSSMAVLRRVAQSTATAAWHRTLYIATELYQSGRRSISQRISLQNVPIGGRRSFHETRLAAFCIPSDLQDTTWPEHDFVRTAEACLEHICEQVSIVGFNDLHNISDFDADFSQGVLTIALGSHGTYVLNTQTPNRQIWLSSPQSGPRRFAWHSPSRAWLSTRDGSPLHSLLTSELSEVFSQEISIDFGTALKSL